VAAGEHDLHNGSKNNLQRIVIFLSLRLLLTAQKAENRFQAQSNKKKSILFREGTQAQFSNSPISIL
jgi:hypothetical protein